MPSRRDLWVVALVALVAGLCQWAKPWNVDEPFFLAIARQILKDPLHPLAFDFNWYGVAVPMTAVNNTPPLLTYLMAAALRLTGGGEFATRAAFFPLDLAAAWSLLALAARFLRRPLLPVLIVVLGPAWLVNMPHLMAERLMAALALPALWLLVVGVDDGDDRAYWASAALAGAALLTKYNSLFVLAPGVAYAWMRGASWKKIALWLALVVAPLGLYQLWDLFAGGMAARSAWVVTSHAWSGKWSGPGHKTRSLFAFIGGCGSLTALAGFALKPSRRALAVCAAAAALLFAPWLDLAPLVLPIDRATGFVLAFGTMLTLWTLAAGEKTRGMVLWASWAAGVAVLQLVYWSVLARFIVFLLPPLVFWAAEHLEKRPDGGRGIMIPSLAVATALGVAVAFVDYRFAWAQREFAREIIAGPMARGRTVWCAAHWGLQEYLVAAGAKQLDFKRGGWEAVQRGDYVARSRVSTDVPEPIRPFHANATTITVGCALPLRHISEWTGEGAFYSSVMGFLPWSFSADPLEEFTLIEAL